MHKGRDMRESVSTTRKHGAAMEQIARSTKQIGAG
jgi:hypothetical protein